MTQITTKRREIKTAKHGGYKPAHHKPYAIARTKKTGGAVHQAKRAAELRAELRTATDPDQQNATRLLLTIYHDRHPRAYIQRGGRYFYCQYCGCRMTPDQTVYARTDKTYEQPEELLCRPCADERGYEVFDREKAIHAVDFSAEYKRHRYIQ